MAGHLDGRPDRTRGVGPAGRRNGSGPPARRPHRCAVGAVGLLGRGTGVADVLAPLRLRLRRRAGARVSGRSTTPTARSVSSPWSWRRASRSGPRRTTTSTVCRARSCATLTSWPTGRTASDSGRWSASCTTPPRSSGRTSANWVGASRTDDARPVGPGRRPVAGGGRVRDRSGGVVRLPYLYQYCEDFPDPRVLTTAARLS